MSFTLSLAADMIAVEAGATVPLNVQVDNKSSEIDRYEMQVEGIDPEWVAIPEAIFNAEANEVHNEKVFFKPARASESLSGNYPFVLRVRSLNSGESRTVQGVVQVKPFHHLSMEINPKKGSISPTRRHNVFAVSIMNLGNTEHTLQLFGNDPEEACSYDFEQEQVSVAPGQQKNLEVEVTPGSTGFISSSRLHGFSISARSIETPAVVASAQAQLEQRPFLTPATLLFTFLLALLGIAWFMFMPKPPTLELAADKQQVLVGEPVRVSWRAENAKAVTITVDGHPYRYNELVGSTEYKPDKAGEVVIEGRASSGNKESAPTPPVVIRVTEPPKPEAPRIEEFDIQPRTVALGETVHVKYKCSASTAKAVLAPADKVLDLTVDSVDVQPTSVGDVPYTLAATNSAGQTVRRKVTIHVTDPSALRVIVFTSTPSRLDFPGGKVTIEWQVVNSVRVELAGGSEKVVVDQSGSRDFLIDKTTTFTLTAYDDKGRKVIKGVKVEVKPAPKEPGTTDTVPPPTANTTGGAGGTTGGGVR